MENIYLSGWHQLLKDYPLYQHLKECTIKAYSEFMPSPKVGISPMGEIDYSIFSNDDEYGWGVSEIEEETELKPGMEFIGKRIFEQIYHLGMGLPAHHIAGHAHQNLINNPYWPKELSEKAGHLINEKFVCLLPLMLSKTQDDKGRVTWTFFGSSIHGPEMAFWKSFYTSPTKEVAKTEATKFLSDLLKNVYNVNEPLLQAGFRILPSMDEQLLPSFATPFLIKDTESFEKVRFLLTFRPFSTLPSIVKELYFSGRLSLLPFPGSLVFWGMPTYEHLAKKLPLAKQIPLQNLVPRHQGRGGMRIIQTGWIYEPHPDVDISMVQQHLLHDNYHRTHRWQRIHRHEDELALPARISGIVKTLFSTELDSMGLYDKPMARNSQLWTHRFDLLLDGLHASKQQLVEVEKQLLEGGLFGYRFFYPPMQAGLYHVYWHRPILGYFSEQKQQMIYNPCDLKGYFTLYHKNDTQYEKPIELWPNIKQRKTHLTAIYGFDQKHDHYLHENAFSIISLFEGWELFGKKSLSRCFAQRLAHLPKHKHINMWLDELPEKALSRDTGLWMKEEIEKLLQPNTPTPSIYDSLTFKYTANRTFEENWWNSIRFLAHGEFSNKDNADCVLDENTLSQLLHHHRDLECLGDYLIEKHRKAIADANMEGIAFCGELPFKWLTDFDFSVFGGWKLNHEGHTYERDIVVVIPGKNRNEAVVLADHYDTAYMEDVFDKNDGGNGARISANGADDNFSATSTLLLAAPIFLQLSKEGKLERDVWLVHLTGEEFPSDCMGARHFAQSILQHSLTLHLDKENNIDLSNTKVVGVFVMDMIGHNNEKNIDVFQISPGKNAESLHLSKCAHHVNMNWNNHTHHWNLSHERLHLERGKRVTSDNDIPPMAKFLHLEGDVRNHLDPYSSLFNTDGQIFSDAGIPVVLFMENYDISRTGYHDTHDTMENIDLDYGSALASICIETVAQVASLSPQKMWKSCLVSNDEKKVH